jgi:hypothetical protein
MNLNFNSIVENINKQLHKHGQEDKIIIDILFGTINLHVKNITIEFLKEFKNQLNYNFNIELTLYTISKNKKNIFAYCNIVNFNTIPFLQDISFYELSTICEINPLVLKLLNELSLSLTGLPLHSLKDNMRNNTIFLQELAPNIILTKYGN